MLVEKVYVLNLNPKESNLTSLPESIFRGLNLESIHLNGSLGNRSNLTSLPEGLFRGLNNLGNL